ncbi:YheT family hydrolase [Christiangramia sabulilitoris]|uniref:Alpha/beta fold hydrolase n=1 Tax=Christiangramia sabulilitoris TaxID=2583991 RepID=A0A550I948_9FLAO|nr:alpha/beta fold hydrolase [Christiangramia sabulilitoris]TRO67494.1 alpha/beta fold hydrolase [Christiangramia sabulilitoris]
MPIVKGNYSPPGIFKNGDASTIYAATLRKVDLPGYKRERIETSDGDFLDLDWILKQKDDPNNLVILLHGLAGKTDRPYMKGMVKAFNDNNWDILAMNFRGCSEDLNRRFRSYHAGASDDLAQVMTHVLSLDRYDKIALVGFSLGGNMLMKYLGENRSRPEQIIGAVGISVPCDLAGSLGAINKMRNFVYSKRFELNLKQHLYDRAEKFPERISKKDISACKSLRDIDDLYTSRAHGFKDASEYYREASAKNFLDGINVPTLMINAGNDSFLSEKCYPYNAAKDSEYLHLEVPAYGGHVGFVTNNAYYYHEQRAVNFIESLL